jgi:hypothetical protein
VKLRTALLGSLAVWAAVVAGTWVAGERTEVVLLHTRDASGQDFATKLWVVDLGPEPWVRVANPRRGWYQRLLANPEVVLERGGRSEPRIARPDTSVEARKALDEAFAEKYGWVDAWYGLLVRRDAVPIRLEPPPAAP